MSLWDSLMFGRVPRNGARVARARALALQAAGCRGAGGGAQPSLTHWPRPRPAHAQVDMFKLAKECGGEQKALRVETSPSSTPPEEKTWRVRRAALARRALACRSVRPACLRPGASRATF